MLIGLRDLGRHSVEHRRLKVGICQPRDVIIGLRDLSRYFVEHLGRHGRVYIGIDRL